MIPDDIGTQNWWSYVEDGSLRNGGLEFVSTPLPRRSLEPAVSKFYEWMERGRFATSIRTSTHVHANVLDHTMAELSVVLAAYAIVEPILFAVCGRQREENIYCVPWYRSCSQAEIAGRAIAGRATTFMNSCKYSSLYLEPVIRFGTLEFRQAPLFESASELNFWLSLVRTIVYDAPKEWATAEEVLEEVHDSCDTFLSKLFGEGVKNTLSEYVDTSFEELIDNADSITIAEYLVPSLCTYKATDRDWCTPVPNVEGDRVRGYRMVAFGHHSQQPMYALDPDEFVDEYDDEEYNEEEW